MDLRKAVDRAKKIRRDAKQTGSGGVPAIGAREQKSGWVSPVYCESRCMELDRQKVGKNRCVCIFPDAPEGGYYKLLRTQVQLRCKAKGWNTVMITSVRPGEGKTLTAINLALTFAKEFHQTTLLVDCDLKRQTIQQYLGLSSNKGLVNYLIDDTPLKDLIIWPGIEKLTVISGGTPVHESTELMGSPQMEALVAEMKNRYTDRYVIFDVPPILSEADAMAFTPLVDCILMVVEAEKTPMQDIKKALELIPKEKFLGFVLNRQKSSLNGYYYDGNYHKKRGRAS